MSTNETRIREIIEARVPALASSDPTALSEHYANDVVIYDAIGPLRHVGIDGQRQRAGEFVANYRGGIDYHIADMSIAAGDDVAFCHYLYRIRGTAVDDTQVDMWVRSTVGFEKVDGDWTITHEHSSVPFDATTLSVDFALQP